MEEKRYKILIVDDVKDSIELVSRNLEQAGYITFTATSPIKGSEILKNNDIDLVITDLRMPDIDGIAFTRYIKENYKNVEIIMITGYPSIESAVDAVKTGVSEFLPKPFTDDELFATVEKVLFKLKVKNVLNKEEKKRSSVFHGIIGNSDKMKKIFELIDKASQTTATVLITGESGTGKEMVARAIHYSSSRASQSFVPVNCGGIPEELLESELFGYVKGSFTGANETRAGFFQTADGGTIFLDEIGETSLSMQVKLLRVLQDKTVYMIGSRKPQKIDVRVICATNKNLEELVKKGIFREDLYFRLNVINVELPPLRERREDIPILLEHFAAKYSKELGKEKPKFTENAVKSLSEYFWPGNVRELENIVQRLIIMKEDNVIDVPDLPSLMRFNLPYKTDLTRKLSEVECDYIKDVYESQGKNKSKTSEILGIDRKTLREKLKRCQIEVEEE
ncbi:MAG: sigma-54 dependent transcriptional regulator [bacterium]|uniref:Two component, sigma54 specific, transcriptional regulator, Fis family n=2 Tax=Bacteria candidate phyla TaxID=1783234 RepID=A0A124G0R5_UNCT6|nr:MAG: Two component, sigma54 specific, transcriptional regulator, Fis family [candidate division TA06 bacterium 32_111]KUK88270.1 MAG: Two component, sigma54 specific, transcriptional regulator, Fis family [candidate division TA06 bacterium 34_109]MDI6701075.1 sigma-54 dependent transcriptional regulator [bacterium]HAF07203.1 sigma-54-dependent Fis family transcriptional regulator [candidate division WOR-3 bacterium]HCP16054.1 sigma-54-dependent Fis family transcriptional regulator [candidate